MKAPSALLYDFLLVPGGAEQMLLRLKQERPEFLAVLGFIDRQTFPATHFPAHEFRALTSPSSIKGWQGIKALLAFERLSHFLCEFETIIYSGVYAPVAVRHHREGPNIYYCHTPPRFIYDLRDYYLDQARPWQRPVLKALCRYMQPRYETAVRHMDIVIANSANVSKRLESHLAITTDAIIHPPVNTNEYRWLGQDGYYLSTARLEPYKRVDRIVNAFRECPEKRLIVASGGSELGRLKALAEGCQNIEFTGWCSAVRLRELVGRCIATIYLPMDEDFGISPVESMAAGKPVIGVAEGGLLETIEPGATGILINPDNFNGRFETGILAAEEAIIDALELMDAATASDMRDACERRARSFGADVFCRRFFELVKC